MAPSIRFEPVLRIPLEEWQAQKRYSRGLGLPEIGSTGAAAPNLAVVGGSPGLRRQLDDLRAWDGEIWAINSTWRYLRDHGIDSTFYRIDPNWAPGHEKMYEGVTHAVLGDTCASRAFDDLMAAGASIELAKLGEGGHWAQTTAAGTAPFLAAARGHHRITFFACESSFGGFWVRTHAYRNEKATPVQVRCGGRKFWTSPQMIMQAEWIAQAARECPDRIAVAGEGFLAALIEHGDYEITRIARDLHKTLQQQAAAQAA
jgi:hypothetical protein